MIAEVMPHRDDAWQTWCTNFKTKIAMAGDGVGLTPAKINGSDF
jgi:hypothetical protein